MIPNFELLDEDFEAIAIAGNVAHSLLRHPAITPRQVIGLGNALFALGRLPRSTPGVQVDFGLVWRDDDEEFSEMRFITFRISEEDFEISRGGSVYDRRVGSDTISQPGWHIEIGGYRCTECELYQLENEVCEFINLGANPSVTCESTINLDDFEEEAEAEK